jgi:hypothetical protein
VSALALSCRDLERDAAPAAPLRVSCPGCDPDSPRSVPREECKTCGGTGTVPPAIATIVEEIHASRLQLLRGGHDEEFDD